MTISIIHDNSFAFLILSGKRKSAAFARQHNIKDAVSSVDTPARGVECPCVRQRGDHQRPIISGLVSDERPYHISKRYLLINMATDGKWEMVGKPKKVQSSSKIPKKISSDTMPRIDPFRELFIV